ncbi:MAG: peptidase domain-containing ABC transporter [Bacteroidales bacterium]|nr:peptidase domain-containing ABC transporter [Bacteroidales bacterium]
MKTDIRQHDISDCAAAVICSVARHYGRDIPLTVIREASGTSSLGTSVKGVIDACTQLGFKAGGYRSPEKDFAPLRKLGYPIVLHIINRRGDLHFVVLYGLKGGKATIMDPAPGRHLKISEAELREMWTGYLIVITPDPGKASFSKRPVSPLKQLVTILASIKSHDFPLALLGSFFSIFTGIVTAVFLQKTIDTILPGGDPAALARAVGLMAALAVCGLGVSYLRAIYALRTGLKIDGTLILGYLRSLFKLPAGFFAHRGAGELNSRIADAVKVRAFLTEGVTSALTGAFMLCASFALMFHYNWKLALFAAAFIPFYVLLFAISDQVNRKVKREVIESAASFEEKSVECISSIRTLKYFDRRGSGYLNLERRYAELSGNIYRGGRWLDIFATAGEGLNTAMLLSVLAFGSGLVMKGSLSAGELVSFYSLMAYFSSPLGQLAAISDGYNEAKISLERLRDITTLDPEGEGCIRVPLDDAGDLEFRNVDFSYPGAPPLLEKFSAVFPAGKITAIRGESGCGKSSLAALLMRDYPVRAGKILAGGTDISIIDLPQWRSHITIVPQEPSLMNASILDNITGGSAEPDLKRVAGLLDELGMKEFVTSLPTGLLTVIGERGALLSGGQRQRIALARALYLEPRILIMDEATSSLDEESQGYILKKAQAFRDEGGTVIMITHRSDNAAIADYIINMDECALTGLKAEAHT